MARHVDLLGLLYVVWGCLACLIGAAMLTLGIGAAAIVASADPGEANAELAAGITAATFAMLAAGFFLWGAAHLAGGIAVRRYRPWGRALGLVLGILNLFLLPFGTALGIYAVWVLISDQTRCLFEPAAAGSPAS